MTNKERYEKAYEKAVLTMRRASTRAGGSQRFRRLTEKDAFILGHIYYRGCVTLDDLAPEHYQSLARLSAIGHLDSSEPEPSIHWPRRHEPRIRGVFMIRSFRVSSHSIPIAAAILRREIG